jgi:hypothetical protein
VDFLTKLRDLPRRYLAPGGDLDFGLVARDIGIETEEDLKNFLLQLYRLDVGVASRVNSRMLYFLLGEKVKGKLPVLEVPPDNEFAWAKADACCGACPGSEPHEPMHGVRLPMCGNDNRIDRWESCMKYRENLRAADERVTAGDESLVREIEEARERRREQVTEFERATDRLIAKALEKNA